MFRLKKEIHIDKRNFDSISELRSSIVDIVRQNYAEYNVSHETISFYSSGGFNFNRGLEGSVIIKEESSSYCVTVAIKQRLLLPMLFFIIVLFLVMSSSFSPFDPVELINRLVLFPVILFPVLLLHWLFFYFSASVKLKDFTLRFPEVL